MAGDQRKFQLAMTHGDRFSTQGQWQDAMKAYRFALSEFPNNAAAINGFGKAALSAGHTDMARKAFNQALRINPTNLEALNAMADVQERSGQLDAAAETYLRMGNVYASRNELDKAVDLWRRATGLVSNHTSAHERLAEALVQQGKTRTGVREYLTLAAIFQRQREDAQVSQFLDKAQQLLPNDPVLQAIIEAAMAGEPIKPEKLSDTPTSTAGELPPEPAGMDLGYGEEDPFGLDDLFGVEDPGPEQATVAGGMVEEFRQKATEQLANLIFEDGENPNAMQIMQAVDAQSRKDLHEAATMYRDAVEAGADLPALYFNLGLLYRDLGQLSDAAEMLEQVGDDEKFGPSANFTLGQTYFATNDYERAIKHFIEAVAVIDMQTVSGARSYDLSQVYQGLSERFMGEGNLEKTKLFVASLQNFFSASNWERKVYEARMRMNSLNDEDSTMSLVEFLETPETEVMITTLAVTTDYLRQNFLMTASEECLRAIQKVPSFLPLHIRLAEILLKQNRTDEAINKYLYVSRVYQMRSQPENAVNIYLKILKLAPMDVTVRSKLIDLYTSNDDVKEALEQYLVLADSYYQLAQVDRALEKYNEAIRLTASVPEADHWKIEALTRMADIYNQRFDWARATQALEQILQLKPGQDKIMRRLVELYYRQNKMPEANRVLDNLLSLYQRQNPAMSLEVLQDLVSTYPDDMSLRERLAIAYIQNSKKREAIAEYDALGEMQLENGLRNQAVQTIQSIINLGPDDTEGYRRLLTQIKGGSV